MNTRWLVVAVRGAALAGVAVVAGCTQPRMARPADLAPLADEVVVTNRSRASGLFATETFGMGTYQVTRVKRTGTSTKSNGWSVGGVGSQESKSEGFYEFDLTAPVGAFKGACGIRASQKSTNVGNWVVGGEGATVLDCNCSGAGAGVTTTLVEMAPQPRGVVTHRSGAAAPLQPLTTTETGGASMGVLGYEAVGTAPLGAVDVAHPGRVWINRTLPAGDQADLACLFAGLLLYKPPQQAP